jgi:hypothetical protein
MNLINHIRQTGAADNIDISYNYTKQNYNNEWECVLTLEKNNKTYLFKKSGKTQKKGLISILTEHDVFLRSLLNNNI